MAGKFCHPTSAVCVGLLRLAYHCCDNEKTSPRLVFTGGLQRFRPELPPRLLTLCRKYAYLCAGAAGAGAVASSEGNCPAPPGPFAKKACRFANWLIVSSVIRPIGMVPSSHCMELPNWSNCWSAPICDDSSTELASLTGWASSESGGEAATLLIPSNRIEGCWLMGMQSKCCESATKLWLTATPLYMVRMCCRICSNDAASCTWFPGWPTYAPELAVLTL